MSADPTSKGSPARFALSCCLVTVLGAIAVVFLFVLSLWLDSQRQEADLRKDRLDKWKRQVAAVKSGGTTSLTIDDDTLFMEFVERQPEAAEKVAGITIETLGSTPGKVGGERFDNCIKRLPHLESISFDETCDDVTPLMSRLAGKKSITSLDFYMTYLTDEGMRAVAAFPNLKHLHVDGHWNDLNWEPLRSHMGLESLVWEDAKMTDERIKILASWPKLQKLIIEIPNAEFAKVKTALPHVKEMSNSMR